MDQISELRGILKENKWKQPSGCGIEPRKIAKQKNSLMSIHQQFYFSLQQIFKRPWVQFNRRRCQKLSENIILMLLIIIYQYRYQPKLVIIKQSYQNVIFNFPQPIPMTECPHCGVVLIDCFLVADIDYLVCTRCAIQYIRLDPVHFNLVYKDNPRQSNREIEATRRVAKYLQRFPKSSLKQLILNNTLRDYIRPTEEFSEIEQVHIGSLSSSSLQKPDPTIREIIEHKIETTITTVSQMIPESIHLHYQIGKHIVQEKYKDMKHKSQEIVQQCSHKWDVLKDKIGLIKEQLPSDTAQIKEKLAEGYNSLKAKWKGWFK